jgi:hypothetical protein
MAPDGLTLTTTDKKPTKPSPSALVKFDRCGLIAELCAALPLSDYRNVFVIQEESWRTHKSSVALLSFQVATVQSDFPQDHIGEQSGRLGRAVDQS